MSYFISEETEVLLEDVKKFCEREVLPVVKEYDCTGELPRELYDKAAEFGYHTLTIPEEYGGPGLSAIDTACLTEAFGYADGGFGVTMAANGLALAPVLLHGNEEQKKRVCNIALEGGYGAFCLTEAESGSDAAALKTVAEKTKGGYLLNGSKSFVTNGSFAGFYNVAARTENGISLFIVDGDSDGIEPQPHEDKMGIRLSDTCEVVFNDVFIPEDNLIGEEGKGFKTALEALDEGRILIGCVAAGIAQRGLDEAKNYSLKRKQFGRKIFDHQAIKLKLADMEMKTEGARQMIVYALNCRERGLSIRKEAAMAKCMASDAAVDVALETIQIMGGYGYSREFPGEKLLRDAKIFQIFEGTNEIQRLTIVGQ